MLDNLPAILSWVNAILGLAGGAFAISQVRTYGARRGLMRLVGCIMLYIGALYLASAFHLIPASYLSAYLLRSAMTALLGATIALIIAGRAL